MSVDCRILTWVLLNCLNCGRVKVAAHCLRPGGGHEVSLRVLLPVDVVRIGRLLAARQSAAHHLSLEMAVMR